MITFRDYYNNEVKMSFADHPFSDQPKHVWVICRYGSKWLLTRHKDRGLEFPGGKVEKGETAEHAAMREVMEETGGVVQQLKYVGQYFVAGKAGHIVKNVYYAIISELKKKSNYLETYGPVMVDKFPSHLAQHAEYSFMMKDKVLPSALHHIDQLEKTM
ncbi:8-oxo-dGTP diphosphatase [Terribacillus halophilus]|uniref:8-oxo-dGTP diphosphatase n=1 Tax=Terribacillus halophilus TaxID=361279 RepID=A0A1G6JQV7_9BACI|nr:nucleoside triphosphatase YtkD [Terribacillus halophilus]SDC21142.1 8-oxo-dGTP diphosphatase [Terribacillus halophilus]